VSETPKEAAEPGKRVYEYVDEQGVVFWSFNRLPSKVSKTRRLTLKSRVGSHLINHLVELRRESARLSGYDDDSDLP